MQLLLIMLLIPLLTPLTMIRVGYLQRQLNVIINKYGTYTEKTLKWCTVKRLSRAL